MTNWTHDCCRARWRSALVGVAKSGPLLQVAALYRTLRRARCGVGDPRGRRPLRRPNRCGHSRRGRELSSLEPDSVGGGVYICGRSPPLHERSALVSTLGVCGGLLRARVPKTMNSQPGSKGLCPVREPRCRRGLVPMSTAPATACLPGG